MKGGRLQSTDKVESDDLGWKGLLLSVKACVRCGGLLTRDEEFTLSIDKKMPSLRCIQCGDWIDELILWNRVTSRRRGRPNRQ